MCEVDRKKVFHSFRVKTRFIEHSICYVSAPEELLKTCINTRLLLLHSSASIWLAEFSALSPFDAVV